MINKKIVSRILSIVVAFVLVFTMFAVSNVETNAASGYVNSGTYISNEYLQFAFNDGSRFALYTTGGDPVNTSDDNTNLLYGSMSAGTSDTILKINGSSFAFQSNNTFINSEQDSFYAYNTYYDVLVELYVSFTYNTQTQRKDTVEFKYVMTNQGSSSATAGARIFFDTMLGNNDSAPFRIPGVGDLAYEAQYVGEDIPQNWYVFDSFTNPSVLGFGKFYNDVSERPDKVQFIRYSKGSGNNYECYVDGDYFGDSAVNVYYDPITLVPGQSRTFATYYGVSEFVGGGGITPPDPFVDLGLTVTADRELLANGDQTEYIGNPFTCSGWVNNNGNTASGNVQLKINLPEGLHIDGQSDIFDYGCISAGANPSFLWNITADRFYTDTTLYYSLELWENGEKVMEHEQSIYLPALSDPHVHRPGSWIVDIEATCVASGREHQECLDCGNVVAEREIPISNLHNYQMAEESLPSCTVDGYVLMRCSNCGAEKRNIIYATGHEYNGDNVCDICGYERPIHNHFYTETVVAPTCVTMGYTLHTCSCGDSYRDNYIEGPGHKWDDGEIVQNATCYINGQIKYTCTVCNATRNEVILAKHDWTEEIIQAATCTTDGLLSRTCNICGARETEIIPAGHNWNEGVVLEEPTCTEAGLKSCVCLTCGVCENLVIDELGHNFYNGICTRCGAQIPDIITPNDDHPEYGMYFEIDSILSNYGSDLINEYGVLLDHNPDAIIKKVAVYLTQDGTMWRRCIACVGENIEYATYVPYLSYEDDIKYTGLNSPYINTFTLRENSKGVWCYSDYATIGVNLEDSQGNLLLSLYDIGQAGAKTRIFTDLEEMKRWLEDPSECLDHFDGYWEIVTEPTVISAGLKRLVCYNCGGTIREEIIPVLSMIKVETISSKAGATITVAVSIQNNPGIMGAVLNLTYDERLELLEATEGSAWNTLNITMPGRFTNSCNFVWDGISGNDMGNGIILLLKFKVPADAEVDTFYDISVSYRDGNMVNADGENVFISIQNGGILIDRLMGDVNDDGVVNALDVVMLRRYIAGGYDVVINSEQSDMNGDGQITVADIIALRRYIVNQ